ncbi:ATP-binding cassette domain-containing protein [Bacillus aerolatus]|uniref:ATP-binding cassette domain-containing protein n=1 Tax=Bacillus aerolatus TaxID=2653354 RepID=A0A6I1FYN3_9BACI|nr:ABC transporter ATP-binding protein [Bacillus aerolatus]KAB7708238.1 ATP-binding cassette domain-containing protein [Bacillus aerolatus]
MINISRLEKFYRKKKRLGPVNLHVDKGEIFGLLGPNGAGKSTLLSILATVSSPSAGKVIMKGKDITEETKAVRPLIGYVPQDIALWEEMTVKENMLFWGKMVKRKKSEEQLENLCQAVQLHGKWDEKVSRLSGGMKRKLNLAVSLIHDPEILLLDEPTVGIDLQSKFEINELIQKLARDGKTIIYITHDINEITQLCTRIGVLKNGIFLFTGTLAEAGARLQQHGYTAKNETEIIFHLLKQDYSDHEPTF